MHDFIMNTLSPILQNLVLALVPILLAFIVNYVKKKTGIDLKQGQLDFIEKAAISAVMQAEGRAMRYAAAKGEKWTGGQKHGEAINKLLAHVPGLTNEQAKHYVDMAVARIPGIGQKDLVARP